MTSSWQFWALGAAGFAAMTAVLAKVGVQGVNSDLATMIRTAVVLVMAAGIVAVSGQFEGLGMIAPRTWLFLGLSGLATGASWLCYFRALQLGPVSAVAPVDKLSVVLVAVFGALFLGERLPPLAWLGIVMILVGILIVLWST